MRRQHSWCPEWQRGKKIRGASARARAALIERSSAARLSEIWVVIRITGDVSRDRAADGVFVVENGRLEVVVGRPK